MSIWQKLSNLDEANYKNCEVFLGGSCNPTTWRADTVIPELKRHGISFYNPQVSKWAPELVDEEHNAKHAACILFFVLDSQTRSTSAMVEVAFLIASDRCVVVVANSYSPGQNIMNEVISNREFADLEDSQSNLLYLVKSKGIHVHTKLVSALNDTAERIKYYSRTGKSPECQVKEKLRRCQEVFYQYGSKNEKIDLIKVVSALQDITDNSTLIYKNLPSNFLDRYSNLSLSFDQFCALVADVSVNDYTNGVCCNFSSSCQNDRKSVSNLESASPQYLNLKSGSKYHIYLGGSIKTNFNWRNKIAIPLLKKHGITYYNPALKENVTKSVNMVESEFHKSKVLVYDNILEWKKHIDHSKLILFVITNDTRSMTSMILASYYMGIGKPMVLVIQNLPTESCRIDNEMLTKQAIKDYNRGRVYLSDLANRRKIPVFENITQAVKFAISQYL